MTGKTAITMKQQSTTIARPYARAAFKTASQNNTLKEWVCMLQSAALIASHPLANHFIKNPSITTAQILDLFFSIMDNKPNQHQKNFLQLLTEYNRLNILPVIASTFVKLLKDYEKTMDVDIISMLTLTTDQKIKLTGALEKYFNQKITPNYHVDNTILGGAIIRARDLVIDGSGRQKLTRLQEYLEYM